MNTAIGNVPAAASGTVSLGGELTVHRLGFGAMRITGDGVWGPPKDPDEAIRVLLNRPREWGAAPLTELRNALTQAPEHFTESNLQRAFDITYSKALVDIISMVKHAAVDTFPLLTAEERVNRTVDRITWYCVMRVTKCARKSVRNPENSS